MAVSALGDKNNNILINKCHLSQVYEKTNWHLFIYERVWSVWGCSKKDREKKIENFTCAPQVSKQYM